MPQTMSSIPLPVLVFAVSATLLIFGLIKLVWDDVIHLSFLDRKTLDTVEKEHPHLPSLRITAGILICGVTLFVAAAATFTFDTPLFSSLEWVVFGALYVLLCALGILMEMHDRTTRDYAFAVTIGSALALLFVIFTEAHTHVPPRCSSTPSQHSSSHPSSAPGLFSSASGAEK